MPSKIDATTDMNSIGEALSKAIEKKLALDSQYNKAVAERDAAAAERRKAEVLRAEAEVLRQQVESRKAEIEREERKAEREERILSAQRRDEREEREAQRQHQMAMLTGAVQALGKVVTATDVVVKKIDEASDVGGLRKAWDDVKSFAEAHPWLTGALVILGIVAVGVVAYTAYDWFFGADTVASVDGDTALRLASGG